MVEDCDHLTKSETGLKMVDSYVKTGNFVNLFKGSNTVLAAGITGILLVMMIPMHPFALDILLSFSITFALIILLLSIYTPKPIDFSVFPSVNLQKRHSC